MIAPLAAACFLAPVPQGCAQDLPLPVAGEVRELGERVEIDGDVALATSSLFPKQLWVWDRDAQGVWGAPSSFETGGTVFSMDLEGDVLLASVVLSGQLQPRVWRRQTDGSWLQDPALLPPATGVGFSSAMDLRGDRLAVDANGPQIWLYEFNPSSGTWDFDQSLEDPQGPSSTFGFGLQLGDDRIVTMSGPSSEPRTLVFELDSSGQWALTQTFADPLGFVPLDLDQNRLLMRHDEEAEIWRFTAAGSWKFEQTLPLAPGAEVTRGVLDGRELVLSIKPNPSFILASQRVRLFRRRTGSPVWLEQGGLAPEGGVQSIGAEFGFAVALDGGTVIAGEPGFDVTPSLFDANQGRVSVIDLDCLGTPPVVHWIPGSLSAPGPNLPKDYASAVISSGSPLTLGAPYGLRDPELSLRADYTLNITGQPCSFSYGSTVCSYIAYSLRDGVTGTPSDDYPLDPFSGFPQFFNAEPGPTIAPSTTQTPVQWPYLFEASDSLNFTLEPTGQPMDLQIAAASYNCFDSGGIFVPQEPETVSGSCGFDTLPTGVQALDLDLTVSGLLAFDLDELGPQNQSTLCEALPNSTGAGSRLTAEGSASISDNALYLAIDNLPPGEPGILVLAAQPATPPYPALGKGQLCLGAPLLRLTSTLSVAGSFGHVATQLDFTGLPAGTVIDPGSTWYLQYVFRDKDQGATTNTSSAIAVTFE